MDSVDSQQLFNQPNGFNFNHQQTDKRDALVSKANGR